MNRERRRRPLRAGLALSLLVAAGAVGVVVASSTTADDYVTVSAELGGLPKCWVGWQPSEGSMSYKGDPATDTTIGTYRLKWRAEDLTFTSCRDSTTFEFETGFNLANSKLGDFSIQNTDLPRAYIDSERAGDFKEVTFGIGDASKLEANHWYTLTYKFDGRLGPGEKTFAVASRGHRLSPCLIPPFDDAHCVGGWSDGDVFGPDRITLIKDGTGIADGQTLSWAFPSRDRLVERVVRDPEQSDAWLIDDQYNAHWVSTGAIYNCLVAAGHEVVETFGSPSIDMRWVINSFDHLDNASCSPPPTAPPSTPPPATVAPTATTAPISEGPVASPSDSPDPPAPTERPTVDATTVPAPPVETSPPDGGQNSPPVGGSTLTYDMTCDEPFTMTFAGYGEGTVTLAVTGPVNLVGQNEVRELTFSGPPGQYQLSSTDLPGGGAQGVWPVTTTPSNACY